MTQKRMFAFLAILLFMEFACGRRNATLVIHPILVFSELDTFAPSGGNIQINKDDYFLIKDFTKDKIQMKAVLDSFVNTRPEFKSPGFANYVVYFYLEDENLNENIIKTTEPVYRYKFFTFYKDNNYLVSYTYRDMKIFDIDWSSEYYK